MNFIFSVLKNERGVRNKFHFFKVFICDLFSCEANMIPIVTSINKTKKAGFIELVIIKTNKINAGDIIDADF